jgi:hypothetical protein
MDHPGRWGTRSVPRVCRRVEPPLGVPQPRLDALQLAADQECPGIPNAQHGPDPDQLIGERLEPATRRGLLSSLAHGRDRKLNQVGRALKVLGAQRVADRLRRIAVVLVPLARPPMKLRDAVGLLVRQARPKNVGEELVVAIPAAAEVERDQEQVAAIERLQHELATALAGDGIAQRAAQPVQDGGLE